MTESAEALLQMDVNADGSWTRILHRVVRSMHDGHCPNCGYLADALKFESRPLQAEAGTKICPRCSFSVSTEEGAAALQAFRPFTQKAVIVFRLWRELYKVLPPAELNEQMIAVVKTINENPSTGGCNGQESIEDSCKSSSEEDTEIDKEVRPTPAGWDLPA